MSEKDRAIRKGLESLEAVIAAAEERGRRRGIESAASQCATTCDAAPWKERWGAHPPPWVVTRAVRDAIEALAPRDSAPVPDMVITSDVNESAVVISKALAQRILAALEEHYWRRDCSTCSGVADELRGRLPP